MSGPVELERLAGPGALERARDAWDAVLARSPHLDPLFCSHGWTADHVAAYGGEPDVVVHVARAGSEPVAAIALRTEPRRGALALRRARLAADGTHDSDHLDLVVAPGFHGPVLDAWLDALRRERAFDAVVLWPVPGGSPTLPALRERLAARRQPWRERAGVALAVDLSPDFDALVASLAPRMRSKVRQALRRIEERGARVERANGAGIGPALDALFALHQSRWEAAGGAGAFAESERRDLYRRAAERADADGALHLATLAVAGATVAVQMGVVHAGRYALLQEGYAPDHEASRPGFGLRAAVLRELCASGARRYDFLEGDSPAKRAWGATDSPLVTLAFAQPRLRARLAYGARMALDRRSRSG